MVQTVGVEPGKKGTFSNYNYRFDLAKVQVIYNQRVWNKEAVKGKRPRGCLTFSLIFWLLVVSDV